MVENRNLILAIVLSVAILLGFQYFFEMPGSKRAPESQVTSQVEPEANPQAPGQQGVVGAPQVSAPGGPQKSAEAAAPASREQALGASPRVRVDAPRVKGSINLTGGRIDDLTLVEYTETLDPDSPKIDLLSPTGAAKPYYAQFGWVGGGGDVALPDGKTVWRAEGGPLTLDNPVTLSWDNGQGLRFERVISIDDHYMFSVTQRVVNQGDQPVELYPYGLISRTDTPKTLGYYILHEGPIGVIDGTLREIDYDDLSDSASPITEKSTGGWFGITDKYWLAALVPDQGAAVKVRYAYSQSGGRDKYQVDYLGDAVSVQPGASSELTSHLFAGAKKLNVLDSYADEYGIENFDLAIDFGWFYFLTRPIFLVLVWFEQILGNFGLAILLLTLLTKGLFFPLANKSYVAMSKMKKLQPHMTSMRERFKDDKMRQQQEMMALYKREKVNPAAGCLPILVQIPVFFALYKVLFVTIEMRHQPFFGWIHDLSAPDTVTVFNLFGLLPFDPPSFLLIGIWPMLMAGTMFLQQLLNPAPADPTQAKIMRLLPVVFLFVFARFPAGLVIYWTWNNILSVAQQWLIMRRMGVKPS